MPIWPSQILSGEDLARVFQEKEREYFENQLVPTAVPWDEDGTTFAEALCIQANREEAQAVLTQLRAVLANVGVKFVDPPALPKPTPASKEQASASTDNHLTWELSDVPGDGKEAADADAENA